MFAFYDMTNCFELEAIFPVNSVSSLGRVCYRQSFVNFINRIVMCLALFSN